MEPEKHFIKAIMKHVVRDKHRPTAGCA